MEEGGLKNRMTFLI